MRYTKMAKDTANAIRLLSALELLPLEKCTSDAAGWRLEIADAIRDLQATAMPADDPLRYQHGKLVSEERFQRRLKIIIDSWPRWSKMSYRQRRDYGREKVYQRNR